MLIRKFFSNFNDDHNSELKKRFLQLWSHFLDIYQQFNQRLEEQGLAYEGALYRKSLFEFRVVIIVEVAEKLSNQHFLFFCKI